MFRMFELRKDRGFSLVELMIVVAIIAILAAIAIPAFMQFAMKAKTSEATGNLSAIRTCEESYRAEEDEYLNCPESPAALNAPPSKPQKWVEVVAAGPPRQAFSSIGFEPDGNVRYLYKVVFDIGTPTVFEAVATGDLDDDGGEHTFTITKGDASYPKPVEAGDDY